MADNKEQPEFWEQSFKEKQEMWGFEPAKSALIARDIFVEDSAKHILVPGFGYGRNAKLFVDAEMDVTGIEISKTAIDIARKHCGDSMVIHHGSVTDMPFDNKKYDGIFCYALIHLLDEKERKKLIADCYYQLTNGCCMIFTVIAKKAHTYGSGKFLSKDRYELFGGVNIFFYDENSICDEFDGYGQVEVTEIEENNPFYLVTCRKQELR